MSALRRGFVPTIAILIWLLQFARNTLTPASSAILSFDGDVALHLVLGDLMLEKGWFLDTEPTNYLMDGHPFIAHEWLIELIMALSHQAWGLAGPILLSALLLATASAYMYSAGLRLGAKPWTAVITCVIAFTVMNGHLHPRPHLFTWWFGLLWVHWLHLHERGMLDDRAWFLRIFPLMLLWAQVHAGFLVAFPLVALFGGGALLRAATSDAPREHLIRFRTLTIGGVGALMVSGLNPWGFSLHAHFLAWMSNDYMMSFTTEFASPDFRSSSGVFLMTYLLLCWVALAGPSKRPSPSAFLLVVVLTLLTLRTARHGSLFAAVTAPWVAARLQLFLEELRNGQGIAGKISKEICASSERLEDSEQHNGGVGTAILVAILVTVSVGVYKTPEVKFLPSLQPIGAVEWIEQNPERLSGRMFNPFRWGAYIAYKTYPARQTYINSWHDHLGEEVLRNYFKVHEVKPGWQAELDKHDVNWVIYDTRSRLAVSLRASDAWERVYHDPTASIFIRREDPTR